MINTYLIILIFLLILFFYFNALSNKKESFNNYNQNTPYDDKYFKTMSSNETIYDDFYSYYYDNLFLDVSLFESYDNMYNKYIGSVYNEHLVVGIKHGGHINKILNDIMKTTSVSNSKSIIKKCKYNYSDLKYKYLQNINYSFNFDNNKFTHISLLDNEIYYNKNIHELIENCYNWLVQNGYLFIQVYSDETHFMDNVLKKNNKNIMNKYVYSSQLQKLHQSQYYLIDNLKLKYTNKNRKNIHVLNFYSNEYIISICNSLGLSIKTTHDLIDNMKCLVFQKSQ